ncbi:MAG TPA: sigma-54-dependent Fis family transcriptional regulator [Candidatus Latescibacteria bacterium]|nr:sigma-54-dependent Fis family transcriptional regulator [Gemmatimonadota bacterium]HCR16841.1 sigma-54-dependent Fis family transcriptional regulator [Candidatus Latescibacterota bacterium]|tara:strand:+ start:2156 stop:3700 length:1545 start_codon:yes stop_codon:yes gene_type:complete
MAESSISPRDALVVVADAEVGRAVRREIEAEGWQTIATNTVGPAKKLLQRGTVDLLVIDEPSLQEASVHLDQFPTALVNEASLIVFATLEGQHDQTLLKGLDPSAILDLPPNPAQLKQALHRIREKQVNAGESIILGQSEGMRQIRETIEQIAATPVSVLITGESGSGKDPVAQSIHALSERSNSRFVTINCGAIPETLLESELFGHEKGAFTDARTQRQGVFEAADGGTVFLDEIGEMSLSAQVRLLRVLESKEITRLGTTQPLAVDTRVIAATNKDLRLAVENGTFRRDLYYRLKVVEVQVPPLRQRPQDIPILAEHFVRVYHEEHDVPPIRFDASSLALLQTYRWPGNVRELRNLVERLMVLSVNRTVGTEEVTNHLEDLDSGSIASDNWPLPVQLAKTPEESQRDLLYWAILEVARDMKELKTFLMESAPEVKSLPVYHPEETTYVDKGKEVEYTETEYSSNDEIRPLREVEKEAIARALRSTGGHRKKAAKLLDMPERTLYRKIQQYDL